MAWWAISQVSLEALQHFSELLARNTNSDFIVGVDTTNLLTNTDNTAP